jgi:hypothetical protein
MLISTVAGHNIRTNRTIGHNIRTNRMGPAGRSSARRRDAHISMTGFALIRNICGVACSFLLPLLAAACDIQAKLILRVLWSVFWCRPEANLSAARPFILFSRLPLLRAAGPAPAKRSCTSCWEYPLSCRPLGTRRWRARESPHVLQVMLMAYPNQAGSLQGSCSVGSSILVVDDPGNGSGWQQSKQNWTLPTVVGK